MEISRRVTRKFCVCFAFRNLAGGDQTNFFNTYFHHQLIADFREGLFRARLVILGQNRISPLHDNSKALLQCEMAVFPDRCNIAVKIKCVARQRSVEP